MTHINHSLFSDSYKYSHYNLYPKNTEGIYSYIEPRCSGEEVLFMGIQTYLKQNLLNPFTKSEVNELEDIILSQGVPFNREGFNYILDQHGGYWPVEIKAVPEGSVISTKNVLVSIESTDPNCAWAASYLEPTLLSAVWYPTTVATNSYKIKKLILNYLIRNGDPAGIDYKLHDFGFRGVSSFESAAIGGLAHLVNFKGTDTTPALLYARRYYHEKTPSLSIPATEHSTITSWGRENEVDAYRNFLEKYAKPGSFLACVSDSYDIYNACDKLWGEELREKLINSGATLVIRPDSGNPVEVTLKCIQILDQRFGSTINSKGYKVLNHVRLIQGDGVNYATIDRILHVFDKNGYSADNIAFGMGGGLLQDVTRDTYNFAMKCSAIKIKGQWYEVFKDPITDSGKTSKKGRLQLIRTDDGYKTISENDRNINILEVRYKNGDFFKNYTLGEVKINANRCLYKSIT